MEKYNFKTAINIDDSNEPFLAVLEYILIPKYIKFLRQNTGIRQQ